MANGRYKVEYAASALEDLRSIPKREADQILRKVLRLEHGLHGNIKRLQNADAAFRGSTLIWIFFSEIMVWMA
jgi:mRNA-degrading endonuclease RelE of RelBE toxin-antitoxin system